MVNKKLAIFSVIFLVICAGAWIMLVGNPFDSISTSSVSSTKAQVAVSAKPAPREIDVPKLEVDNAAKPDSNLIKFKSYLQHVITNDKKLSKQDKNAYLAYVEQINKFVEQKTQAAKDIQQLQQLSEEYRIKTLQSQVLEQESKISAAKASIQSDQFKAAQALGLPAQQMVQQVDHVTMIYGNGGKLQADVVIDGVKYTGKSIGDAINNYKIAGIQSNQVTLLDSKIHKTKILDL
jgi:hypothetical protein